MEYISIGTIKRTHGYDGTMQILPDFEYPELVYKTGNTFYIGKNLEPFKVIEVSKNNKYYMTKLDGINSIDKLNLYLENEVFMKRSQIKTTNLLRIDLIGMPVFTDKFIGKVTDVLINSKYDILKLDSGILLPNIPEFIVTIKDDKIIARKVGGLTDEN